MFAEDLDVFLADFGVDWQLPGKPVRKGIFDTPDELVTTGAVDQLSTMYQLKVKTSEAAADGLLEGATPTINGVTYTVRGSPRLVEDGAFTLAMLTAP